ncbi:ankyrin repeat-containing domain protein [Aspergillus bertholletiae]|uniref:Ankyrin repeat-containing domain protein n=1 Tax=Aspergillus bertholletiae TaxID=1226010 RepID=A0A5N7B0A2_9EURO|nr:ankyrin repeat-containing domain protein [Aspergillus bertholletiae]
MTATHSLPPLPAKHQDFLGWIDKNQATPINQLIEPYNEYEAVVRRLFAQEPSHLALRDNHLNVVPLYDSSRKTIISSRPRDPSSQSLDLQEKYVMPLKPESRRACGDPAVVSSLEDFRNNFNIFSEGSLSDMDWNNVVVAGSAVVTCLMPVPEEYRGSKRALRQFYHDKYAPASDVDLFLYGLTEEQAIEKIKQIEDKIKNAILYETTTIRTKNTITIVSQYPTRHVQIVLRIYKSISEILTGFDVDCSCAAFDGKQVYASPRALAAYITQANTIDLTRRSPSYENRLSKYSHRGFEIFCPQLDRQRVDPTIYERSFSRTVGLARLLVLERLPKSSDRDAYLEQRREERGRPVRQQNMRRFRELRGNIKNDWEDEIPEWMEGDEYSNYHTMTIPYGPKFHAKKIERLVYTKDLLLNAEWNKPKDRDVNLHRHPAFFGNVEDVIHDCCGYCPEPITPEEKEVAEQESKHYISGHISFIKDDPGRQEIGSFNPITDTDWTEMAYVGNTEHLCQAIVDHDLTAVKEWLSQSERDPNSRDYTGRTPLHLACMASTPEIVQCLVDHGARLISRLADGRTALHIAAARGNVEMIKILLHKSETNEAEEDQRQELRKDKAAQHGQRETTEAQNEPDDIEMVSVEADTASYTSGSFVKVQKEGEDVSSTESLPEDENAQEPDIYDINAVSWDSHTSPLHLAILKGHVDVVEELVATFGADVLLPIKLLNNHNNSPRGAILTLVLTLQLPIEKAKAMTKKLLQLGASPAQADLKYNTPLHYIATSTYDDLIDVFLDQNKPATLKAINSLAFVGYSWNPDAYSAFMTAINAKNPIGALKLLEAGAEPSIDFEKFVKSGQILDSIRTNSSERNREIFRHNFTQPVILAIKKELPELALELVNRGVDPNTLSPDGYRVQDEDYVRDRIRGKSLLDCVRDKIKDLRQYQGERVGLTAPQPLEPDSFYLENFEPNTYQLWTAERELSKEKNSYNKRLKAYEEGIKDAQNRKGVESKLHSIQDLAEQFEKLEIALSEQGAKTFKELFPNLQTLDDESQSSSPSRDRDDPFKVEFTFKTSDLTDEKKGGYIKLFEAAWRGDLDTIKSLTLAMWGENNEQPPLRIAITDSNRHSPFSIAACRGHLDVAKAILKIVQAQYSEEESSGQERFEIGSDCSSEDSEDNGNLRIYSEIIDDKFTVDDIGEVAMQVKSHTTPLEVLKWYCPKSRWFVSRDIRAKCRESPFGNPSDLLEYAVWMDDIKLLAFLLEMGEELASNDTSAKFTAFGVSNKTVHLAIAEGRLRCLEELIKRAGADLPLDALVHESGVQMHEKPEYYQGLSIHGKKRADWAAAGRGQLRCHTNKSSPLLVSAVLGSLKSTEWYMSTAPSRHYVEFSRTHEQDHRLKLLAKSTSGIEKSLMSWLKAKNNLVLHCAILSTPTLESRHLVEYLVQEVPECLETRSAGRYTPLALAYSLNRADYADILIKAGASQTVRDSRGNNLIHLLLCGIDSDTSGKPGNIERLLKLLDPRVAPSLLLERSSDQPGSVTPFARWMHHANFNGSCADDLIDIARIILEFAESTGQKHLELLDGTGNTPVHYAVKHELVRILELMMDHRPDLLYRENATGSTPLELEEDAWIFRTTSDPPNFQTCDRSWNGRRITGANIVDMNPESFLPDSCPRKKSLRDVCQERATDRPKKRKLVTLNEANEVAKRLAAQKFCPWGRRQNQGFPEMDEVAKWYGRSDRTDELTDAMEI